MYFYILDKKYQGIELHIYFLCEISMGLSGDNTTGQSVLPHYPDIYWIILSNMATIESAGSL